MIGNNLKQNGVVSVLATVNISRVKFRAASELHRSTINGAANVGERSEFFESLSRFDQSAFSDGDLDEFWVELGC